jgi:hypothetical protein
MSSITRIHIEYADGSTDEVKLLPQHKTEAAVYWLAREVRQRHELTEGPYSIHVIAGFLYQTALACQHTGFDFAFDFRNPKTPSRPCDTGGEAA